MAYENTSLNAKFFFFFCQPNLLGVKVTILILSYRIAEISIGMAIGSRCTCVCLDTLSVISTDVLSVLLLANAEHFLRRFLFSTVLKLTQIRENIICFLGYGLLPLM